jgi:hypothetical protein
MIMQKVITLPIRCSTVKKMQDTLPPAIGIEWTIAYLLSWAVLVTTHPTNDWVYSTAGIFAWFGTLMIAVFGIVGYTGGWYPKFECIGEDKP